MRPCVHLSHSTGLVGKRLKRAILRSSISSCRSSEFSFLQRFYPLPQQRGARLFVDIDGFLLSVVFFWFKNDEVSLQLQERRVILTAFLIFLANCVDIPRSIVAVWSFSFRFTALVFWLGASVDVRALSTSELYLPHITQSWVAVGLQIWCLSAFKITS